MGNKTLLMFAIMVIVVIVGTALDMTPTILILTPDPDADHQDRGIDPVYFGVLFIINNAIRPDHAAVGGGAERRLRGLQISMEDIIKGVWPFMIAS
jgi:TRAP-type C4-dicarboxylate transport system permease large subunit